MIVWPAIVGAIAGALVTGLMFLVRDSRQQALDRKREKRGLLITKFEKLYSELEEYASGLSIFAIDVLAFVQFDDEINFDAHKEKVNLGPVMMKGNFYAPELDSEFSDLRELQKKFMRKFGEIAITHKSDKETRSALVVELTDISHEVSEHTEKMCEKLSNTAKILIHDT